MRKSRRIAAVVANEPMSVWQALNQPIVEVSEEFGKGVLAMSAFILLMVWVAPYWGQASTEYAEYTLYSQTGQVAGALIDVSEQTTTPDWYYTALAIPSTFGESVAQAANEVLDVSEPVQAVAEFYQPGAQAFWDGWLELMADPY